MHLNTLIAGPAEAPTLVLLHGWGAGAAFFARNIIGLSATHHWLYIVDWPGFGASSRPPFASKWDPRRAESFFVDALAAWAEPMPAHDRHFQNRFHVAAHSLGAYLATSFDIKFPGRVRNLVLASPVGVPRAPLKKVPARAEQSWAVA